MSSVFEKALPVWQKDFETEINHRLRFKAIISAPALEEALIKIATSGIYNLHINGEFIACGPARAGKNHFRVDEFNITKYLSKSKSILVIEVCGYNANSFSIQNQKSFLQAEVTVNGELAAFTGDSTFKAQKNPNYYQKTQRYSFQRPMVEAYNIKNPDDFYITEDVQDQVEISGTEHKRIIERLALYPHFERINAKVISKGNIRFEKPQQYFADRAYACVGEELIGFKIPDLDVFVTNECQDYRFEEISPCSELGEVALSENSFAIYSLPYNATGMVKAKIRCHAAVKMYILFDEILSENKVDFLRMTCANAIRYDFCAGEHDIQFFDVYTMKYMQFCVMEGSCSLEKVSMVEYKHPPVASIYKGEDEDIRLIAGAAVETYRQNSVDIFMDCPSRERAGWLCDSFFTARTEYVLTGRNPIEKSFLENFLHEEDFECLPEGVLPMCYPSDHYDGYFIPNWNMWLVLELEDYLKRSGDEALIAKYKVKMEKLFLYFEKFENADGFLEKLEGWVFVEWSEANKLVQDVNYPTNMMYSAALKAAGRLYNKPEWISKAEQIKSKILKDSFNGQFFTDNAVRVDGKLVNSGETTEVAQYYAFFCEIATPETHKALFDVLIEDFGPERKNSNLWPKVHFAAPFIGYYLRLDIMMKYGYKKEVFENIKGFFLYMAQQTGTLWENAEAFASCNHGFASYVLYWLNQM